MSDYFPEEVVIEILSRVPAKSLVRFLLVSKSWYSLITRPDFISVHLNNVRRGKISSSSSLSLVRMSNIFSGDEHCVVYSDGEKEEVGGDGGRNPNVSDVIYLPFKIKYWILRMVGTCDGLVYLSDNGIRENNYLWNPSVRKYVKLPPPSNPPPNFTSISGFEADFHGDYKVVRVVYREGFYGEDFCLTLPPEVEVYSLSTGVWKRLVNVEIDAFISTYSTTHAPLNGFWHWISNSPSRRTADGCLSLILRFDVENESFSEIMLPDELSRVYCSSLEVSVYMGHLSVIAHHITGYVYIWVMKQYGVTESWTRLFTIDKVKSKGGVAGFRKNDIVVSSKGGHGLATFDPKTSKIRDLGLHYNQTATAKDIDDFEETLVLLGRQNASSEKEQRIRDHNDIEEDRNKVLLAEFLVAFMNQCATR